MTETFSTSRERAEAAFVKTQSHSVARDRIISEIDAAVQARDEKTSRLRAMRLAKEASDLAAPPPAKAKRSRK